MLERHLRPDEIDLLLDGEAGFGVQPLKAHVKLCVSCNEELERARVVMDVLEDLPHFVPSPAFADKVMVQVQVFEPWHVAATDMVRRFVPQSRPARVLAGAGAVGSAGLVTAAGVWAVKRADIALLLADAGLGQVREQLGAAASDVVVAAVGHTALEAMQSGGPLVAVAAGAGFLVAAGAMVAGLRRITVRGNRS